MVRLTRSENTFGISGSTLKIIAIVLMVIDHIGAVVFANGLLVMPAIRAKLLLWSNLCFVYDIFRMIGRSSFPIFCFLLVEGYCHTRDAKKYALRLGLFALLSEIPFDLSLRGVPWDLSLQNIFFTLLIGLLAMIISSRLTEKGKTLLPASFYSKISANAPLRYLFCFLLQLPVFAAGCLLAYFLKTDYSYKGILLIYALYAFRFEPHIQAAAGAGTACAVFGKPLAMPPVISPSIFAFLPILFYNGKRGLSMRYVFYWFYPVHLLLFFAITRLLLIVPL